MIAVLMLGLVLVAWAIVARSAQRYSVTVPIAMAGAGVILTSGTNPVISVDVTDHAVKTLVEITLAAVLFTDATEVSLRWLRESGHVPMRILTIGFPLTILAGLAAGIPLLPGAGWQVSAILAAALAATDSTPITSLLHDKRLPARLRHAITVVSGLDDGLAAPVVLLLLAGAAADIDISHVAIELLVSAVIGIVAGAGGARLFTTARERHWSTPAAERVGMLALAITCFALATVTDGNGFVAAFVAGVAFRAAVPELPRSTLQTCEDAVAVLSAAVWFVFGSLVVPSFTDGLEWTVFVYAVASLTVIRMVPVAISLIGTQLPRREVLALGFWGPRGLDSMVLGIIALEQLPGNQADWVADVIVVTITLSILIHGLSGQYFAKRWRRAQISAP